MPSEGIAQTMMNGVDESPGRLRTRSDARVGSAVLATLPDLSLIVPTLNEAENLPRLLRMVSRALRGISHEIIVADDASRDETARVAEDLRATYPALRILRRTANFGLSAAIVDGFRNARGSVLAVMDADLQHDPRVLPGLIAALSDHDIAIGSRYAFCGRTCGWSKLREIESRLAAFVTQAALGICVRDPLSGFFMMRRQVFTAVEAGLSTRGWKLLLEILALSPAARVAEVPFTFRARRAGKTKMSMRVVGAWLTSLVNLRRQRFVAPSTPYTGSVTRGAVLSP